MIKPSRFIVNMVCVVTLRGLSLRERTPGFTTFFILACLVTVLGASITLGDDDLSPPADVDQRLLDGLDDPAPSRPNPSMDVAGEDLGAAQPQSTLASLARLMRDVEQRMRRNDTSAATTQLQSDIAEELAKMLESAEQENASSSTAASASETSEQASTTNPDGTEGDPQSQDGNDTDKQPDLLDAIWGTLPERLRQQIQSPLEEEFLPGYERVIKQYYKRLAEEQRRLRD